MDQIIYTIGYTGFTIETFVETLLFNQINVVIDVRSSPYSERYPDYNKNNLESVLKNNKIYYRNYATEFGARQENRRFYTSDGYLDFELFSRSEQFLAGVKKIENSVAQGFKIVFLCAEKKPEKCHRTILVARAFSDRGYPIVHLLPDGKTITQKTLEQRWLNEKYPSRNQQDMFSDPMDEGYYICQCYRKLNKEIAYHIEEEEE